MGYLTRTQGSFPLPLPLILMIAISIVFITVATILQFLQHGSLSEFILAILAIVSAASLTRIACRGIVTKLQELKHELLAGIFAAVFSNIAELCFVCTAVARGESTIAKTALTGSLVSSCLMAFGTCLLSGGIANHTTEYPVTIAKTNAQLLVVSLVSVVLPTAFRLFSTENSASLLNVSRGSAIVLLLEFLCYILFFYYTHLDGNAGVLEEMKGNRMRNVKGGIKESLVASSILMSYPGYPAVATHIDKSLREQREKANKYHPKSDVTVDSVLFNSLLLTVSITSLAFASIFMFESIHAPSHYLSESFVGLVLMPCVLASAEYVSDAARSRKEGIAWVAESAFGSSIRVSLFVFPVAVILGWISGEKMDMNLDGFQVSILALSVLMVNHVIHNTFAHWLEGSMFIASFALFAIAAFYYPNHA